MDEAESTAPEKRFRYLDFIMVAFVTILICSNLMAGKRCSIYGFQFGAGIMFFPLSYLFGDVLTEVYGYSRSRRIVWAGFGALTFASLMSWVIVHLPPAPDFTRQAEYEGIFGQAWRVALGSLTAYFFGEFVNSFTLAKMKVRSQGRHMWRRFVGSTVVGELVDSLIFYPIAFGGLWQWPVLVTVLFHNYGLKVLWEFLMLPWTYRVVRFLKRVENIDYFDEHTNFTPFSLADS